jgi:hypothetical protein
MTYYVLLEIYSSPVFKDPAKLANNMLALTQLCPDALAAYNAIPFVEDRDKLRELTVRFRRAVDDTRAATASYRRLWAAEFRAADPSAFDALRAQVATDIERVKRLDSNNIETLRKGYKLTGNTAAADALPPRQSRVQKGTYGAAFDSWHHDHPLRANPSPDERDKFNKELLEATGQWVKEWPDEPLAWRERLISLSEIKGTSNEELERTGDSLLDALKRHPYDGYLFKPFQTQVAEAWSDRDIRLEKCLTLAQEALQEIDRGPTFLKARNDSSATATWILQKACNYQ